MIWLLMKAAICFVLAEAGRTGPGLYKLTLAQFCLSLAEQQVELLKGSMAHATEVDLAVRMLQKAATKGSKLARLHFDMREFTRRVQTARAGIDGVVTARANLRVSEFMLPNLHDVLIGDPRLRLGTLPGPVESAANQTGVTSRTTRNLGIRRAFGPFVTFCEQSLSQLLEWSERLSIASGDSRIGEVKLFCRGFEDLAIEACAMNQGLDSLDARVVKLLEKALDAYRELAQQLAD